MKKKLLAVLLIVSLATLSLGFLAGCDKDKKPGANDDKPYIGLVALGYGHQFWQAVKMGAEQAANEYGYRITFEGPEEETMVDKQVDMLKTVMSNNPVAVGMAAIDPESVAQILQEAKDKGVKIVGFDAGTGPVEDTKAGTDNLAAGALAAENVGRILDGKGKIGIVGHSQTVVDAVQRVEGFVDKIKADFPDIEILDIQYGDGDHLKSAEITKAMLNAHPEIQLIYTSNEGACVGAYNGLKEANKIGEVQLVGFDSSAALKEGIRNGDIVGAITQDPVGLGYATVEAAVKLLKGEEVPKFIDTGCKWYNKDNMDDDDIAPLLYD